MAVDNRLMIKKLQAMELFYSITCTLTRNTYVECDPETFDDQVYLFAEKSQAEAFSKDLADRQYPNTIARIDKKNMLSFYSGLYYIGVNRLAFHNGAGFTYLPLSAVVTMKQPPQQDNQPPRINSALQLTSIYFLQELRRPNQDKQDKQRIASLREMEQEMLANVVRSRFILAVDASEAKDASELKNPGKSVKVPFLRTPNGTILQPAFSDIWEFQKFNAKNGGQLRLLTVPFEKLLPTMIPNAQGFVLNPVGVNLVLGKTQLEALAKNAAVLQ